MYRQATLGDVDFITGDYLAGKLLRSLSDGCSCCRVEVNLANNAETWRAGKHPGYEETAWEGIQQTMDVIAEKGIKVVINGGALDPKALALKVQDLVCPSTYVNLDMYHVNEKRSKKRTSRSVFPTSPATTFIHVSGPTCPQQKTNSLTSTPPTLPPPQHP
jgi:hypothetical protein